MEQGFKGNGFGKGRTEARGADVIDDVIQMPTMAVTPVGKESAQAAQHVDQSCIRTRMAQRVRKAAVVTTMRI